MTQNSNSKHDIDILVCCHKKDFFLKEKPFLPIQVGKDLSNIDLGIQGDNTGDNISKLNPCYCELTAHYWYWKNMPIAKYVGLNHYRRYFGFGLQTTPGVPYRNITVNDISISKWTQLPDFDKLFNRNGIVMSQPNVYPY